MDQKALDKELFNALNSNDFEGIKKALENGASGNAVTKKGTTPLMIVAKMNHNIVPQKDLADLLIEAGADVNYVNKRGFTVVSNMMKSAYFDTTLLEHLINNHGVDMNQRVVIKQDGELKEFSLLDYAYLNSINESLIKLLKDNGAKSLSDTEELKDGFEFRYRILDKGFRESGIYDIIEDFKKNSGNTLHMVYDLLSTLNQYINEERYLKGNEYLGDIEEIVEDYGDDNDRLIYLYLKASIYICLNRDIEALKSEIDEIFKREPILDWDFDYSRNSIENSGLREEIKGKLFKLTDCFKY